MKLVFNDGLGAMAAATGNRTRLGTVMVGDDEPVSHPARQFADGSYAVLYFGAWVHSSTLARHMRVSGFRPGYVQ